MENKSLCGNCIKAAVCMGKCSCGGSHWGTVVYVWDDFDGDCEFYNPDEKKGCDEFIKKEDNLYVMVSPKPFDSLQYKTGDIVEVSKNCLAKTPKGLGEFKQLVVVEKIGPKAEINADEKEEVVAVKVIEVLKAT